MALEMSLLLQQNTENFSLKYIDHCLKTAKIST